MRLGNLRAEKPDPYWPAAQILTGESEGDFKKCNGLEFTAKLLTTQKWRR